MIEAHHPIRAVARRTGLSAHVIRVWEKRYGAVEPARTETNRRLYSDEQIERLRLLRDAIRAGHTIGHLAKLPTAKLKTLAGEASSGHALASGAGKPEGVGEDLLERCISAVQKLDSSALESALNRAETVLGSQGLLQRVVAPLAQKVGDLWREGSITAAHEHFASVVIRAFLGHLARPFAGSEKSPVLLVTTPAGQLHELGALLAAAAASSLGWRVTYLGASLPAAEIAGVAIQNRARAVALSLVYPEDDPGLDAELRRLRELLPRDVALLVGGRAAPAYRAVLEEVGARQMSDLDHLCSTLDELRRTANAAAL